MHAYQGWPRVEVDVILDALCFSTNGFYLCLVWIHTRSTSGFTVHLLNKENAFEHGWLQMNFLSGSVPLCFYSTFEV